MVPDSNWTVVHPRRTHQRSTTIGNLNGSNPNIRNRYLGNQNSKIQRREKQNQDRVSKWGLNQSHQNGVAGNLRAPQTVLPSRVSATRDPNAISWSSLFKPEAVSTGYSKLSSPPILLVDGLYEVPQCIIDEGIKEWSEYTVGFFIDNRLSFPMVREKLKAIWKLSSEFQMAADRDLFYFKFSNSADRRKVQEMGPLFIAGRIFLVQPWSVEIEEKRRQINVVPIWVNVYKISKQMWTTSGLGFIASLIGTPKYVDNLTVNQERLEYARVCVEIGVETKIEKTKSFRMSGKIETVNLEYPWLPTVCSNCCRFGHSDDECPHKVGTTWCPIERPNAAVGSSNRIREDRVESQEINHTAVPEENDAVVTNMECLGNTRVDTATGKQQVSDGNDLTGKQHVSDVGYDIPSKVAMLCLEESDGNDLTMSKVNQCEHSTLTQAVSKEIECRGNGEVVLNECHNKTVIENSTDQQENGDGGYEISNQVAMQCLENRCIDSNLREGGIGMHSQAVSRANNGNETGKNLNNRGNGGSASQSIVALSSQYPLQVQALEISNGTLNEPLIRYEVLGSVESNKIAFPDKENTFQCDRAERSEGVDTSRLLSRNDPTSISNDPVAQISVNGVSSLGKTLNKSVPVCYGVRLLKESDPIPESMAGIIKEVDMVSRRMDIFLKENSEKAADVENTPTSTTSKNKNSALTFSMGPRRSQRTK